MRFSTEHNLVATTTTNAQGGYLFTYLIASMYRVEIAASNFAPGGALAGFLSSAGLNGSTTGPFEPVPNNNIDNQDKGTTVGAVVQGGLIDPRPGTQPTGETPTVGGISDPALDTNSNLTQDFGFFQSAVDVVLSKTADATTVFHGALVGFTMVVRNLGPGQATNVVVSDALPVGLTFVSADPPTQGRYDPATMIWTVGTLANGATASLRVVTRAIGVGPIINTASVAEDQADPNLANNLAAAPIQSVLTPAEVSKQDFLASTPGPLGPIQLTAFPAPLPGSRALIVTGADAGNLPLVQVFDRATGQLRFSFLAYDASFRGGVRVALGDVNGDGVPDIITAAGPGGGPHVKVFDGVTGQLIRSFFAYAPTFLGGVAVAAGDVEGAGRADIITGAGAGGGPHVRVFRGTDLAELASFFASDPTFTGGVRVGAADVTGMGKDNVLFALGSGRSPSVMAYDVLAHRQVDSFFAYDPSFLGGVFIGGSRRS